MGCGFGNGQTDYSKRDWQKSRDTHLLVAAKATSLVGKLARNLALLATLDPPFLRRLACSSLCLLAVCPLIAAKLSVHQTASGKWTLLLRRVGTRSARQANVHFAQHRTIFGRTEESDPKSCFAGSPITKILAAKRCVTVWSPESENDKHTRPKLANKWAESRWTSKRNRVKTSFQRDADP